MKGFCTTGLANSIGNKVELEKAAYQSATQTRTKPQLTEGHRGQLKTEGETADNTQICATQSKQGFSPLRKQSFKSG